MLDEIIDGRSDLVFEYLTESHAANSADKDGISLVQWCAYYGDVGIIKFLLSNTAALAAFGDNLGVNAACLLETLQVSAGTRRSRERFAS
jgi:uncharacterized protein